MKKSIIAGAGIAALSMAVLPFAGVFAAEKTVVNSADTVVLTIGEGCTMVTERHDVAGRYNLGVVAGAGDAVLGGEEGIQGTDMEITCNNANGWKLTATATALKNERDDTKEIAFGSFAKTSSVWSVKLTGDSVLSDYKFFDGARVAGGTVATKGAGTTTLGEKITPYYKAYVADNSGSELPSGTYEGTITYTFTEL